MNERELAEAYKRGVRNGDPGRCPDPETLRKVIEGGTTEALRLEVINHAMTCESCRREFDLLDALHQAGSGPRLGRAIPRWAFPAAAAAAAVVVGVALWSPWSADEPVFRGGGAQVELITDRDFRAGSVRLVWRPVPDAVQYELRVTTSEGIFIASRRGADTTATFSADWTEQPGSYQWRVTARRPNGTAVQSELGRFRIE